MESFKDLLLKLQEAHEREVEALQVKIKELANKKGCDTKRLEELFTRNHQMKEQQRVLTENIKTLENRLRAGLCDRCTVTQEVAKRKQQDYEASQLQSFQHISHLAGEMTNLRKENLKLKDVITSLRAAPEVRSEHSINNTSPIDVKPKMSSNLSPSEAVALVSPTISRANSQSTDGDFKVKTEVDHRETECRPLRGTNRSSFEAYKPQTTSSSSAWKTEQRATRFGERSIEAIEQHSSIHSPPLWKKSSPSPSAEVKPSRPVIHAPIPCHPKPIKSGSVSLPWPLSECSDWVSVATAGASAALQTSSTRLHLPRFPNLIPPISPATTRRQSFGSVWQKQNAPQPPKEPTVVFTFRRMPENTDNETKPSEKTKSPPLKTQQVSGEHSRESCDGPLDLSERPKSKPNQRGNEDSPIVLQCDGGMQTSPDRNLTTQVNLLSPSLVALPSSSSTTAVKHQEQPPINDHIHEVKDQDQTEETNGKKEQSNGKKVPVLTLSLRPALVRLETLPSALQKQDSISTNGKSSSLANEADSSLDEQENKSGSSQESKPGSRRKRLRVETDDERESDTKKIQQERRIKITMRTEDRNPS